ncbi:MAG: putative glycoside hydrolase [Candidatus Uhrbacteria bacterium]
MHHCSANNQQKGTSRRSLIASGFVLVMLLAGLLSLPIGAQREPNQRPRLANLFLKWHLSEEEARDLARWDVVVLGMEVAKNTPKQFALLRKLNPDAKLLAYVTAQEIRRDAAVHPQAPLRRVLAEHIAPSSYLLSTTGERVFWWPQTWLLNMTDPAWTEALASFVATEIASDARWDGVYFDNLWGGISWFDRAAIDFDNNGAVESAAERDKRWVAGTRTLLERTRALARPGFLITGNGSPIYADLTNGLLLEHFPNTNEGGWSASMRAYKSVLERAVEPALAMLNVNTENTGSWWDWRRMRFGITSALLGEGYYSFDFGDQEHAQRWWYDEYNVSLGEPKGEPMRVDLMPSGEYDPLFTVGVYKREYEHGLVLVNATETEHLVTFDEEFEQLQGTQDTAKNTGRIVSEVLIAPQDGAILLRPIEGVRGAPFANGAFARVFHGDGVVARNGFFAYDGAFQGGATIEYSDLDRDGVEESIVADGAMIRVISDGREVRSFAPFGEEYRGGLDFAIADLDENGTWEIVVAQRDRGGLIGIFNLLEGRLLTPFIAPFGTRYASGMTVAVARRSVTGRPSIIVGAGRGARPEVRMLDWSGKVTKESFLAFDAKFSGGVRVAAGDLDHDSVDEIVVGAGPGGGPHVRVFGGTQMADGLDTDGTGITNTGSTFRLLGQFFAFDADRRGGVDVAVVDLDGDGRGEILGMSTYVFTVASSQ